MIVLTYHFAYYGAVAYTLEDKTPGCLTQTLVILTTVDGQSPKLGPHMASDWRSYASQIALVRQYYEGDYWELTQERQHQLKEEFLSWVSQL